MASILCLFCFFCSLFITADVEASYEADCARYIEGEVNQVPLFEGQEGGEVLTNLMIRVRDGTPGEVQWERANEVLFLNGTRLGGVMARGLGLVEGEVEEVVLEGLGDVFRFREHFDPTRGSFAAFLRQRLRNPASNLIKRNVSMRARSQSQNEEGSDEDQMSFVADHRELPPDFLVEHPGLLEHYFDSNAFRSNTFTFETAYLFRQLGWSPEAIAERFGVSPAEALRYGDYGELLSNYSGAQLDGIELGVRFPDKIEYFGVHTFEQFEEVLSVLGYRKRILLRLLYVDGLSSSQVTLLFGYQEHKDGYCSLLHEVRPVFELAVAEREGRVNRHPEFEVVEGDGPRRVRVTREVLVSAIESNEFSGNSLEILKLLRDGHLENRHFENRTTMSIKTGAKTRSRAIGKLGALNGLPDLQWKEVEIVLE